MRAPEAQLYVAHESAEGAIVCDTPQPARQGRYILLVYIYIYGSFGILPGDYVSRNNL